MSYNLYPSSISMSFYMSISIPNESYPEIRICVHVRHLSPCHFHFLYPFHVLRSISVILVPVIFHVASVSLSFTFTFLFPFHILKPMFVSISIICIHIHHPYPYPSSGSMSLVIAIFISNNVNSMMIRENEIIVFRLCSKSVLNSVSVSISLYQTMTVSQDRVPRPFPSPIFKD